MSKEEAIDILEHFLDCFYDFPDWNVLSEKDTEAIETLIRFAKDIDFSIDTIMQKDDCDDLVPTLSDLSKKGFKEGDKVRVTIRKWRK